MILADSRAAEVYAEADRLARLWEAAPASVEHMRHEGSRHVNWQVGDYLVRDPKERRPTMVTAATFPEADVLRMFSGSGFTAELLHDGGTRHIQEYLPGKDLTVGGPGWQEWLHRAPDEIPAALVTIARVGTELWQNPQPAAKGWLADSRRIIASATAAIALRESLYRELGVPWDLFRAALTRPLTGDCPQVGAHKDTKLLNFRLTPSGIKFVDVELYGPGDNARDLGLHLLGSPYSADEGAEIAERTQAQFARELPAAAHGLVQDAELYHAAYGASQVMGTLNQRLTTLEADIADIAPRSRDALEERLVRVAADIQEWTNAVLESFGRDPWKREHLVSAIGQWVLYDHPQAPGRRTSAPRQPPPTPEGPLSRTENPIDLPDFPGAQTGLDHIADSKAKTAAIGLPHIRPNTTTAPQLSAAAPVSAFAKAALRTPEASTGRTPARDSSDCTQATVVKNRAAPPTSLPVRERWRSATGLDKQPTREM